MSVVALKVAKQPIKQPKGQSKRARNAIRRQTAVAGAIGSVAVTLTALSLCHLAHGITIVTGAPTWEAWAMAAGIDLGFIAMELSNLTAVGEKLRKQIAKFTGPAIIGTMIGSAAMNAFAFASQTTGWMTAAAVVLGVAIPAMIYALMRVCAALYIDTNSRGA